jgi:putative transposase
MVLPGGDHGLVQAVCPILGDLDHDGNGFLLWWPWRRAFAATTPGIFNTDQDAQFTSGAFTDMLKGKEINISMDGRGRAMDNIFTERLWRSLKYEEVYIRDYKFLSGGRRGIDYYFNFYNHERPR